MEGMFLDLGKAGAEIEGGGALSEDASCEFCGRHCR